MRKKPKDIDCDNSAVAQFALMEIAAGQGDFERAAEAKRQLERLGVIVRFKGKLQRRYREAERAIARRRPTVLEDRAERSSR